METAAEPAWVALKDEELLTLRICDLGVRIEGSELEPRVRQFYDELAARGVALRPDCYLGDEWFSPAGVPAIAIPFYLAHPRLKTLELRQMLEVEGGTARMVPDASPARVRPRRRSRLQILVAQGLAARLRQPRDRSTRPKPTRPQPYSRSFVRHLPNWYAQAHPDEDFAETFAVWLGCSARRLAAALPRLEGAREARIRPRPDAGGRRPAARWSRAGTASPRPRKLRKTLGKYYAAPPQALRRGFPRFLRRRSARHLRQRRARR